MDTSETYYRMCYEAFPEDREQGMVLKTQDQLQEMIFCTEGTYDKLPTKVFAFSDYWEENGIPIMFNSLHQLWLAFVMKGNNKTWDGESWR